MLPRIQRPSSRAPVIRSPGRGKAGRRGPRTQREKERLPLPALSPPSSPTQPSQVVTETEEADSADSTPAQTGGGESRDPSPPTPVEGGSSLATQSDLVVSDPSPGNTFEEEAPAEPVVDPHVVNGKVRIMYEQYDELFDIADGSTSQSAIDEMYCLSFVMPDCRIHLSDRSPAERTRLANEGIQIAYEREDPEGVYRGLCTTKTYYVYVDQEAERLHRDQAETKARLETAAVVQGNDRSSHREFYESCSCLFGNPCLDEYVCKDWNNRLAVATKHGWKGF